MENTITVPMICTRGIVVFPGQDVLVEVGRQKSINAVNEASDNFDGQVFVICQKDVRVEDPQITDLYDVGTLCKIKVIRRKQGYMRITFTGMKRAKLIELKDDNIKLSASIEILDDIQGDLTEELALVKKIISEFEKVSNVSAAFPADIIHQLSQGVSAVTLTDQFGQYLLHDQETKQKLLETLNINERMLLIIAEMEKQQRLSEIENTINMKVKED